MRESQRLSVEDKKKDQRRVLLEELQEVDNNEEHEVRHLILENHLETKVVEVGGGPNLELKLAHLLKILVDLLRLSAPIKQLNWKLNLRAREEDGGRRVPIEVLQIQYLGQQMQSGLLPDRKRT